MPNFTVKVIEDKKTWEDFLLKQPWAPFYQAWYTAEFYREIGKTVFTLGIYDQDHNELKGVAMVVKEIAKRGSFLYCPHGPVLTNWNDQDLFKTLIDYLQDLARTERVWYIKIPPYIDDVSEFRDLFKQNGFKRAPMHSLVEESWLLDLRISTEELLRNMKKNHRNLIRRAAKEGVTVRMSQDIKDLEHFYRLYEQTAQRHQFIPYSRKFVNAQVKAFKDHIGIFLGEYNNEVVSAAIVFYYGKEAVYYHGASSSKYGKIPVSYLTQWTAIQEAQKRGMHFYNFWGIYSGHNLKHPFRGITHFKKGFGGFQRNLLPCQDLPIKSLYLLTRVFEYWRKFKRGF